MNVWSSGYWFLDDPDDSSSKKWSPPDGLVEFIDQAHRDGKKVVYIGFGSIGQSYFLNPLPLLTLYTVLPESVVLFFSFSFCRVYFFDSISSGSDRHTESQTDP